MILEKIKKDRMVAMKTRNNVQKNELSTLIAEIERTNDGNVDDIGIFSIIKKMIENNISTNTIEGNEYLDIYLPKKIDLEELKNIINDYVNNNNLSGMKSMGNVMNYLKDNFGGRYDGGEASAITKQCLL